MCSSFIPLHCLRILQYKFYLSTLQHRLYLYYNVYSILYKACVCSISEYGSEIFGYEKFDSSFKLHLRAARAFLGLPKNVTSFGLASEIDWLLPENNTKIKMIRHFGRLLKTPDSRLMKKVYTWDKQLNESQQIFSC